MSLMNHMSLRLLDWLKVFLLASIYLKQSTVDCPLLLLSLSQNSARRLYHGHIFKALLIVVYGKAFDYLYTSCDEYVQL